MNKQNEINQIDVKRLNEVMKLGGNILKILVFFLSIIGLYAITLILKEWQILSIIVIFLKILSPFFIGLFIAWLLKPVIKFMEKKGIRRVVGISLLYIIIFIILYLSTTSLIPILLDQINDFLGILPNILEKIINWFESFLTIFANVPMIDAEMIKVDFTSYINGLLTSITTETPTTIVYFVSNFVTTLGLITLGLMIGFYLLFDIENIEPFLLSLIPDRFKKITENFLTEVNKSLFSFIKGILFIAFIVALFCFAAFSIIGVKTPLLLALICGTTNIIPYIGPFIGGGIAVVVALTQDVSIGILALVLVTIIQTLESIILQPLVMGKTMKMHPVTILLALLVFGHFFGALGMIVATPLVATIKTLIIFINKNMDVFRSREISNNEIDE